MRIGIAMSGGMNSSLVAVMMKKVGYEVIGITANFIIEPNKYRHSVNSTLSYYSENIIAAKRIAKQYNFPHKVINLELDILKKIIKHNIKEHVTAHKVGSSEAIPPPKAGEYPQFFKQIHKHIKERFSSCMICNWLIIDNIAKYAKKIGCQKIATGHYARINRDLEGRYSIAHGFDTEIDHFYLPPLFTQELLEFVMFPLGDYHKGAIKKLAKDYQLPVTEIVDCKDYCFL